MIIHLGNHYLSKFDYLLVLVREITISFTVIYLLVL